ncbi:MAG: hypothetical protein CMN21_23925 [Rubinisphaera sp.]|nr:hypothetical protein [Rubinisphaera sp.]
MLVDFMAKPLILIDLRKQYSARILLRHDLIIQKSQSGILQFDRICLPYRVIPRIFDNFRSVTFLFVPPNWGDHLDQLIVTYS